MATESSLWKWLSKARATLGPSLHVCRIENLAGAGAPDVEGCYRGVEWWLELKIASKRPARATTKLQFGSPLRDSQVDWARARLWAGGRVGYLIQVGAGVERKIYLIPGLLYPVLHTGVTEEWCASNNLLDDPTPAGVVLAACNLETTHEHSSRQR